MSRSFALALLLSLTACDCGSRDPGGDGGGEAGGGGDRLLPAGGACLTSAACATGVCADGVCCTSACDAPCQACAGDGTCGAVRTGDPGDRCGSCLGCSQTGTCEPVALGDYDLDCLEAEGRICDGTGACRRVYGETCASDAECFGCADGSCRGVCVGGRCATGIDLQATPMTDRFAVDRAGAAYVPARTPRGDAVLLAFGYTGVARDYPLQGAEARVPAIGVGETVFVVDGRDLVALSPSRVQELWRFAPPAELAPGVTLGSEPAIALDGRTVLYALGDVLLRVEAGVELARWDGEGATLSAPSVARDGTVFVTSGILLRALGADTLAPLASAALPAAFTAPAAPSIAGDVVLVSDPAGVAAFSRAALADGPIYMYVPDLGTLRGTPVVVEGDGVTALVRLEEGLDRIQVADGARVARIEADRPSDPCALADGSVLFSSATSPMIRVGRDGISLAVGPGGAVAPLPSPAFGGGISIDTNGFLWAVPLPVFEERGPWSAPRGGPAQEGREKAF